MALFRLEAKIIGRAAKDKAGKPIAGKRTSVVAKAAYRSGERLRDTQAEKTFNYRSRAQEVVHKEIVAPEGAPSWMSADRGRLWNEVETVERRKDSQLAREFVIALPTELSEEAQIEAVRSWCKAEIVKKGFVADFAVHRSKDGRNPHAHVLTTLRPVEGEGFGKKPDMAGKFQGRGTVGKGGKSDLAQWRKSWEAHCNTALEEAGRAERVDHRSLKDQGLDRLPQPKMGPSATALERKGVETRRGLVGRWNAFQNRIRSALLGIERMGEVRQVPQYGVGATWWEQAQTAVSYTKQAAVELLNDTSSGGKWQTYEATRRAQGQQPEPFQPRFEPQPTRTSPDMERG